ncbi:MAG TPA: hypothetical protein PLN21_21900 [Gemmatales bacterium]|nr:hypothetical protein [Gemmatales bacterium]
MTAKNRNPRWAYLLALLLTGITGTLFAVSWRTDSDDKTYVGLIKNAPGGARVALVTTGDAFVAYACSNDKEFNGQYSRWFKGTMEKGKLKASADGVTMEGKVEDGLFIGTLACEDKKALTFNAWKTSDKGYAGLYRAEDDVDDDHYVVGWIVDPALEIVGAVKKQGQKPGVAVQSQPAQQRSQQIRRVIQQRNLSLPNGGNRVVQRRIVQQQLPAQQQNQQLQNQNQNQQQQQVVEEVVEEEVTDVTATEVEETVETQVTEEAQEAVQAQKVNNAKNLPKGKKVVNNNPGNKKGGTGQNKKAPAKANNNAKKNPPK